MNKKNFLLFATAAVFAQLLSAGVLWGAEQTRSFNVTPGETLEMSIRGGIVLNPWTRNEVVVRATGIDDEDLPALQMVQAGSAVRVDFRLRGDGSKDAQFEVSLPAQFNINLRTSGGNIEIRNAMTGDLRGATSGGSIRLTDVSGKVDMKTSGGNIHAGNIQGDIVFRTSGGSIELGMVGGTAEVHTSGGNISVANVGKTLNAKTAGGNISVGDVGGQATVTTAGGNLAVGTVSGSADLKTAGGNIELRGGSGTITAKTAGGGINIKNVSGSVDAKTAGGNVEAELIPSGSGTSRLETAGGDVKLFLPEGAKASIDARIRIQGNWESRSKKYEIRSDFPHQILQKDQDAEEIRAAFLLNGGGERISLQTVNGNIEIRKMSGK